jgi:ketosteroid isomerase-like protein
MNTKSIIEASNIEWNKAFNAGDVTGLVAFYSEGAVLSPGNGTALVGRVEIGNLFKSFIDAGVNSHTLEILEVGGADNMIFQVTRWGAKGADANGAVTAFGGITTSILEKNDDGQWLVKSHVWNANP